MKENEFLDGISNIESDVVERFVSMDNRLQKKANRSKIKSAWLRLGAVAACLALIVGAVMVVQMLRKPDNINHSPIIFDATVSPEILSGSNLEFVEGSTVSANSNNYSPLAFRFGLGGFIVKAKVVKNHPDKYYKLDVSSEKTPWSYRLIQMETIEVIQGENVPQYFLYLIRSTFFTDMSIHDSLLICMSQLGTDKYVLKNVTQNRMEYFELPIFTDSSDRPDNGNMIAFTNGIFDERLWENKAWGFPNRNDYVAKKGDSEKTVIKNIKKELDEWHELLYERNGKYPNPPSVITLSTLNFETKEAQEAMAFVEPFKNGVFSQQLTGKKLIFKRFINGCQTEETVTIDISTEEVTYSDVRYTYEDMAKMENISAHLSEMAKSYKEQVPLAPHVDPEGKTLWALHLYAWYAKVDGKLYGVIKTGWLYYEWGEGKHDPNLKVEYSYYDESYILYDMSNSKAFEVSREYLLELFGHRNLYRGGELGAKEVVLMY